MFISLLSVQEQKREAAFALLDSGAVLSKAGGVPTPSWMRGYVPPSDTDATVILSSTPASLAELQRLVCAACELEPSCWQERVLIDASDVVCKLIESDETARALRPGAAVVAQDPTWLLVGGHTRTAHKLTQADARNPT